MKWLPLTAMNGIALIIMDVGSLIRPASKLKMGERKALGVYALWSKWSK